MSTHRLLEDLCCAIYILPNILTFASLTLTLYLCYGLHVDGI